MPDDEDRISDDTAEFDIQPTEAGEITVDVEAYTEDGDLEEFSGTVAVDGDNFHDLTPDDDVAVMDTEDISVQVTDSDATPRNTRDVTFSAEEDVFNVSETDEAFSEITFDGSGSVVEFNDGEESDREINVNDGVYTLEDVTFERSADITMEVVNDGTTVYVEEAVNVVGVERYGIATDVDDDGLLVTQEQQVNHSITDLNSNEEVVGDDLEALLDDLTNGGEIEITQDEETVGADVRLVDTTDDEEYDAIAADVTAIEAENAVNVSLQTSSDEAGETSLDVVEPDIETSLGDDHLTEGLEAEGVEVEVTDPRDGSALSDGELNVTALEGAFSINVVDDGEMELDDSDQTQLDENGTVTLDIGTEYDPDVSPELAFSANANADNGADHFGNLSVESGMISTNAPDQLDPDSDQELTLTVRDANDERLDEVRVAVTGAVDSSDTGTTDEGFVTLNFETTSGTIDVEVEADNKLGADSESFESSVVADEISVLDEIALNLTADNTSVEVDEDVEFSLVREDFDAETQGNLTVFNESGDEIETIERDGSEGDLVTSFSEEGEYEVVGSKEDSDSRTFVDDAVNITVGDIDEEPSVDDYRTEDDTVETDNLRDAIADWRADDIDTDLLRDVIAAWRSS